MKSAKRESNHPTFVGIGGMKCGTTWLSECLRYHPEIFMSARKEIHYFASKSNRDKDVGWYLEHFRGSEQYKAAGEFSASYLRRADAAGHIKKVLGNVKILLMLRDPVDRFISHYKHLIRSGLLPNNANHTIDTYSFRKAIDAFPKLLAHGTYYRHLTKFIDAFGAERICIVLKEDVDKNPKTELENVYRFLEVDSDYTPPILKKQVSPGIVPRFPFLERLRIRVYRHLNHAAPRLIVGVRQLRLAEIYRHLNSAGKDRLKPTHEIIEELSVYYRDDVHNMEHFLGRRLGEWKSSATLAHHQVE